MESNMNGNRDRNSDSDQTSQDRREIYENSYVPETSELEDNNPPTEDSDDSE
jgi:hypothetical protein